MTRIGDESRACVMFVMRKAEEREKIEDEERKKTKLKVST
jgi:hypothetical protein